MNKTHNTRAEFGIDKVHERNWIENQIPKVVRKKMIIVFLSDLM